METLEHGYNLKDLNGKDLKVGSKGRLSEQAREELRFQNPKLIEDFPNLRFRVMDIDLGSGKILVSFTEFKSEMQMVIGVEQIVIENY